MYSSNCSHLDNLLVFDFIFSIILNKQVMLIPFFFYSPRSETKYLSEQKMVSNALQSFLVGESNFFLSMKSRRSNGAMKTGLVPWLLLKARVPIFIFTSCFAVFAVFVPCKCFFFIHFSLYLHHHTEICLVLKSFLNVLSDIDFETHCCLNVESVPRGDRPLL